MSMSASPSKTTDQTTTSNYDQRVANESGIAIGAGGTYINTFNPDVAATVQNIIGNVLSFSQNVLSGGASLVSKSIDTTAAISGGAIASNQQISQNSQLGNSSLLTQLIPVLVIGAVGIIIFMVYRKH